MIQPNFSKRRLVYMVKNGEMKEKNFILAIVVDADTETLLMHAFMDEDAWQKTCETDEKGNRFACFYSVSRDELWLKGKMSGNKMQVQRMYIDCDGDAVKLCVKIQGDGNACHTGNKTCFFTPIE